MDIRNAGDCNDRTDSGFSDVDLVQAIEFIKLADLYTLSDDQKKDLDAAIAASEKGIGVKFAGLSADERKLSVAFARKIKSLSASEQAKLERILL